MCPDSGSLIWGIGSNLGDRLGFLRLARSGLDDAFRVTATSGVYESAPWGPVEQPDYLNAVLETAYPAHGTVSEVLTACAGLINRLESQAGRVREQRWGPRTLDVDLVAALDRRGNPVVHDGDPLIVPHPRCAERGFVVVPWAEIAAPGCEVPGLGPVAELARRLAGTVTRREEGL